MYHTPAFREQVINFPFRTPPEDLRSKALSDHDSSEPSSPSLSNGNANSLNIMMKNKNIGPGSPGPKPKPPGSSGNLAAQVNKEESKDSSEYKKKMALANGPIINMDFSNGDKYGMPESLFTSVKDLFEAMIVHESRTGVVSPQKLLDILRKDNEVFRAPIHQDAHEFLNVLLNQAVENVEQYSKEVEARRSLDKSSGSEVSSRESSSSSAVSKAPAIPNTKWIHDLFEGTLTSETRCLTCENTSARDEPFLDLSVDLDVYSSVTSCLLKFSQEEMLCERNKFYCDQCCGLQEAEKRMKIKRLPKILALHLKRFKYTDELQRLHKLFHLVSYPYYLRLLNTTDDAEEPDRLYELYAVCVHIGGGPYHGHYVSIVKTQDRGWLLLDDENVEPVEKFFVLEFFGGEQNLACAYVLFYQETTVEAMHQEQEAEGKAFADSVLEANGKIHANGSANGFPPSPGGESQEFAPLDRSVTAPVSPLKFTNGSAKPSTLEQVVGLPFLSRKKSVLMSKKDREREDKEKKEADKEMERLMHERKREAQASAGWASRAKEEPSIPRKSLSTSSRASQPLGNQSRAATPQAERPETGRENGSGFFSGSMSRLKQTSKSFKGKQRLWPSSKSKPESAVAMPPPSFQPPPELPSESHAVATHVLPPVSPYGSQPGTPADLLDRAVERREPPEPPERPERREPPEPPVRREPPEPPERSEWPGTPEGRLPPRPPSRPPRPPPRRPPRPELLDPPDRPPPQPTDEAAYRDKQLPAPPPRSPPPLAPRLHHALTTPSRISEEEVIRLRLQSRGETPITALPAMEAALGSGSGGRKKEKRGLWGLGRKKSVMGL